jgi:hypothetical protein
MWKNMVEPDRPQMKTGCILFACWMTKVTHSHSHSHTLTYAHTLTLTHTHTRAHTLTYAHTHTHSHPGTLAHTHSHQHTLTHSHAHTHTHSLTHTIWNTCCFYTATIVSQMRLIAMLYVHCLSCFFVSNNIWAVVTRLRALLASK